LHIVLFQINEFKKKMRFRIIYWTLFLSTFFVVANSQVKFEDKLNSHSNEFPLYISGDTLYFVSDRPIIDPIIERKLKQRNDNFFLYAYPLDGSSENPIIINPEKHLGSFFPTKSKTSFNGVYAKNKDFPHLNTYNSQMIMIDDLDWNNYGTNINSFTNWNGQPSLSHSGNVLFFISDRNSAGGFGLDVFYSIKDTNGKWGMAKPLTDLNTFGNDITPHYGDDGRFYYSSNGILNDTTNEYNLYSAPYKITDGVLIPMPGTRIDGIQSGRNEFFPVVDAKRSKLFFASDKPYPISGINIFSIPLDSVNPKLKINMANKIPSVWLYDKDGGSYFDLANQSFSMIQKNRRYAIRPPQFIKNRCNLQFPEEIEFKSSNNDTIYQFDYNYMTIQAKPLKLVIFSNDSTKIFIKDWWKPLNETTYNEYKDFEKNKYNSTTAADSFGLINSNSFKYNELIIEGIVNKIKSFIKGYDDFNFTDEKLYINVKTYSKEFSLKKIKTIYIGDTVEVGFDKDKKPLIIPTGLDITSKKWSVGKNNFKLAKNSDGMELLTLLRSYYFKEIIVDELTNSSPIFMKLLQNNRVIFDLQGGGISEFDSDNIYSDRVEIIISNYSVTKNEFKCLSKDDLITYSIPIDRSNDSEYQKNIRGLRSADKLPIREVTPMSKVKPNFDKNRLDKAISKYNQNNKFEDADSVNNQSDHQNKVSVYFIEIAIYDDFPTAMQVMELLKQKGVENPYIDKIYNNLGRAKYHLRSSRSINENDTRDEMRKLMWVPNYINSKEMLDINKIEVEPSSQVYKKLIKEKK